MQAGDINHRPPRSWTKLTIEVDRNLSETITAFLADLTGGGVEHNNCYNPHHQSQADSISAYLPQDADAHQKLTRVRFFLQNLAEQHPKSLKADLTTEEIIEEDWNSNWKSHFKPLEATARLVIKPTWEEHKPKADQFVIEMDPGMAFGTGMHASTQMALQFIDELYPPNQNGPDSVLDVGTGTGILGMSCALLGCRKAVGIDNDIDARVAATNNINDNKLAHKMDIVDQDLSQLTDKYELVIANIIYNTLMELALLLTARLAPKGFLIMAGILSGTQIDEIVETYKKLGLSVVSIKEKEEWSSVCMRLD